MNKEQEQKLIECLKRRRLEAKVSQDRFAEMLGMSKGHISAMERGLYTPSLDTIFSYCNSLHITPNELLDYEPSVIPRLAELIHNMDAYEQDKLCDIIELIQHQKEKQDEREPE